MVMLCFVLDLRSISPPVLRDLKQSLLQLGNYYALWCPKYNQRRDSTQSKPLLDRIGLCYILRDRISCTDQLKVAYEPHGNFNLRDFYHAVNNLPTDAFSPESNDSTAQHKDLKLRDVLSEKIVYTWGDTDENVAKKLIVISSCHVDILDSMTMKALMDAADNYVKVDFVFLMQMSSHLGDVTLNIKDKEEQTDSLKNCSFRKYVPDVQVLFGLAKRWFIELTYDLEEPAQARFIFKSNLNGSVNQIFCNLFPSYYPIVDGFDFCSTCRCHGIPLDHGSINLNKRSSSCPIIKGNLGDLDIVDTSVKVGEQTVLHMPSFWGSQKLQLASSPIDFNVIQRTNLGSLSEDQLEVQLLMPHGCSELCILMQLYLYENIDSVRLWSFNFEFGDIEMLFNRLITGATYFVTPSTFHDSDENAKSELNNQLFQVVGSILNSLDQGLVCSSNCNIDTAMKTLFNCYYILLPSDKGQMLLRRLSAAEEFLPIPDINHLISSVVVEEVNDKVRASLLKMEISDYNPVQHERGFHQKLKLLVKESLQFGAILSKTKEGGAESDLTKLCSSSEVRPLMQAEDIDAAGEEMPQFDSEVGENKIDQCITEEWEQLIVTEAEGIHSNSCTSNTKVDQLNESPSQSNRPLDEKTSRILERLEVPRQLKRKSVSPTISSIGVADVCAPMKKPLIPFGPIHAADQVPSQPMKPSFQRTKKKR